MGPIRAEPRLLAVDDNSDMAELVARVAKKLGYSARSTCDPKAVEELVRSWKPEVMTMDLCMPELDAIELFRLLKKTGFEGRLIIISGQNDTLREAAGKLAELHGIDVFDNMRKPIELTSLRLLLSSLLQDSASQSTG